MVKQEMFCRYSKILVKNELKMTNISSLISVRQQGYLVYLI